MLFFVSSLNIILVLIVFTFRLFAVAKMTKNYKTISKIYTQSIEAHIVLTAYIIFREIEKIATIFAF